MGARLGEMLIEAGLVTERQITDALARNGTLRVGSALIADGIVEADVVSRTLAQQKGLPAMRLSDLDTPDPASRALIPDALARRLFAVGLAIQGSGSTKSMMVAMRDPGDLAAIDELTFATGMRITARVAPERSLRASLERAGVITAETPAPSPISGRVPTTGRLPTTARDAAATSNEPGLDLDLDLDTGGLAKRERAVTPRPAHAVLPTPVALSTDPAPFQSSPVSGMLGTLVKLAVPIGLVALGVYSYQHCYKSTTSAVGPHWSSKVLGLAIDFPDAGWRVAPGMGAKVTKARAEYFYRGNAPEFPVVGLIIVRGTRGEAAEAAETLLGELVDDLKPLACKPSYARDGAIECSGMGTVGLFGKAMQNAEVEVHAWPLGAEIVAAGVVKPDRTLSETEFILGSIVELP